MSVRNALGKTETERKSQHEIPACMQSAMLRRSLATRAREGEWQLCSLSCGMRSWGSYDCFTNKVKTASELPESFLLACGVPLLLTNYFIPAST